MSKIRSYFKSEFARNVLTVMTGTTFAQSVPVLISPILSRIYTPEEFGIYALFTALTIILSVLSTGQYQLAVMLPKKDRPAFNILFLAIMLSLGFVVILLPILFLFKEHIAGILSEPGISYWLIFVPISIFLLSCFNSISYWLTRKKRFKFIAVGTIVQAVATAVFYLIFGFSQIGTGGLIFAYLLGQLAVIVIFFVIIIIKDKKLFAGLSKKVIIREAKKHREFPSYSTWAAWLNALSTRVPIFLLMYFFDTIIVGYFSFGLRLLNKPVNLLGVAMSKVFYQKAAETRNISKEAMARIVWQLFSKLMIVGIFPVLLLMIFAPVIFGFVFGDEWRVAGVYTRWLAPWYLTIFVSKPIMNVINIEKRLRTNLYFNLLFVITRVIALGTGGLLNNALLSVILYGISSFIVKTIHIIWTLQISGVNLNLIRKTKLI